jgi:fido (protein-threonine AMPylation protein)
VINHCDSWLLDEHPEYDKILEDLSRKEMINLSGASSAERIGFMKDPRELHSRLYSGLTPESHPEYAGTYRGTCGTSLEFRSVKAFLHGEQKGVPNFAAPDQVETYLKHLSDVVDKIEINDPTRSAQCQFSLASKLFYIFGLIHPFLDGNGHIQRLMFAAAILQSRSLDLSKNWTIHPRAYNIEMAEAFNCDNRMQAVANVLKEYVIFN